MAEIRAEHVIAALRSPRDAARRALAFGVDFAATARWLQLEPGERLAKLHQPKHAVFGDARLPMIDPLAIARHLGAHGVRYVLVGGSAMRARGMQYATDDYAICYDSDPSNVRRLIGALQSLDPLLRIESRGVSIPFHLDEHTLRGTQILTLATSLGNVDLLSHVDGLGDYARALARSSVMCIGDDDVPVLRYDGLVDAKRAAGRGKDLFVLPELEALAEIEREMEGGDDSRRTGERA